MITWVVKRFNSDGIANVFVSRGVLIMKKETMLLSAILAFSR